MSVEAIATPRTLLDVVPAGRVRDVAAVVGGATIVALVGQAVIPLPFTPVPLTLGTLGVLMVGAVLGPVRAALSVALLLAVGVAGLPVFADGGSGWAFASFGYVLGYAPATMLMGMLARRGGDRRPLPTIAAAVGATATVYLLGVPWLMVYLQVSLPDALALGVVPFLLGDALKAVVAALCLPGMWQLVRRRRA